jgi:PTS system nitrogen regulatory IIA component
MDSLGDLLAPDAVAADLVVPNKKVLFQQLSATAARLLDVDARLVAERLGDRERLGSTGFGGGVAIPHAKIEGLPRVVGLFARLGTRSTSPRSTT